MWIPSQAKGQKTTVSILKEAIVDSTSSYKDNSAINVAILPITNHFHNVIWG